MSNGETFAERARGLPHEQIEEIVGVTGNTICEYFDLYHKDSIDKLNEINHNKPEGELVKHIVSLEIYFRENPPLVQDVQKEIEEITGMKYSETQVREFLKKNLISGCISTFPRLSLVSCAHIYSYTIRSSTVQRLGRA